MSDQTIAAGCPSTSGCRSAGIDAQASYTPWRAGDNSNSYQLFTAGGLDFVVVYLGFDVDADEVAWANDVLGQYADRNAMVMTHAYNRPSSNPDGRGASASHDGATVLDGYRPISRDQMP